MGALGGGEVSGGNWGGFLGVHWGWRGVGGSWGGCLGVHWGALEGDLQGWGKLGKSPLGWGEGPPKWYSSGVPLSVPSPSYRDPKTLTLSDCPELQTWGAGV